MQTVCAMLQAERLEQLHDQASVQFDLTNEEHQVQLAVAAWALPAATPVFTNIHCMSCAVQEHTVVLAMRNKLRNQKVGQPLISRVSI